MDAVVTRVLNGVSNFEVAGQNREVRYVLRVIPQPI